MHEMLEVTKEPAAVTVGQRVANYEPLEIISVRAPRSQELSCRVY